VTILSLDDPCYPHGLKEIYDPPLLLYVRGGAEVLNRPGLSRPNVPVRASQNDPHSSKIATSLLVPGKVTHNLMGTERADQAGRQAGRDLGKTCGKISRQSTTCVRLTPSPESSAATFASLFPDEGLPPHERRLLGLLKADEATHIDELIEKLESEKSSSEIFAARFELELNGKVRQMPGENLVKSF